MALEIKRIVNGITGAKCRTPIFRFPETLPVNWNIATPFASVGYIIEDTITSGGLNDPPSSLISETILSATGLPKISLATTVMVAMVLINARLVFELIEDTVLVTDAASKRTVAVDWSIILSVLSVAVIIFVPALVEIISATASPLSVVFIIG